LQIRPPHASFGKPQRIAKAKKHDYMKKTLLFLLLIPMLGMAQQPAQSIQRFFDALSLGNRAGMQQEITPSFTLVENGEIWNLDTLVKRISKTKPADFSRINQLEILTTQEDKNSAFVLYKNKALIHAAGRDRQVNWLETAYFVKKQGEWKMANMHSSVDAAYQTTWELSGFKKADAENPIMKPDVDAKFYCPIQKKMVGWENKNVLNPTALVYQGKIYLLYRAQDSLGTSRIGLAISSDGIHFTKQPTPILAPAEDNFKQFEWKGGIEDPRVIETEDGQYLLTYTSYDGKTARLCSAISKDLQNWIKLGPMLASPKYINMWSKSGALVGKEVDGHIIATKIDGFYWMYFGDTDLFMAKSADLRNWEVCENAESQVKISVLHPRSGYFDSRLVEPGPYALLRPEGILLIYNSSNAANFNEAKFPKFTYAAGQALFDAQKPYRLINRSNHAFIWPDKDYEHVGEVNEVCFVEGLVHFNGKWFMYYGTADSKIAVAVKE
jgi:predicted GH43/DUF377 family glycosyl hydrolase